MKKYSANLAPWRLRGEKTKKMKDLSLHILDVVQNSVSAGAKNIVVSIAEDTKKDTLTILIQDDGKGMAPEVLARVTDPYYTTRTTRHVGLGLPLFKQNAEMSGGSFHIESEVGRGTVVKAVFGHSHIDRPPLGDMAGVLMMMVGSNPEIEYYYKHSKDGKEYIFDTREVKEVLEGLPLNDPAVLRQLKEMVGENLREVIG
jgi:anti-sigma regulatory factor (Ser/Thr protein kinase)